MKPVVAHVITGLNTGGAEMMLARLLACHEQSTFRPVVFCLSGQGPVADRIKALGITIHSLGMRKGIPDPFVVRRLARLLRTEGAVVVQSWLYHADLIGGLAGRMAGLPVSWGVHNSRLEGNAVGRSLSAVIRACRTTSRYLPACVVCVADSAKTAHVEMGYPAAKMLVIPNGFDLDQFRPDPDARRRIRAELGICDQDPVIVIAGRFVPLKNHQLFVEAAGRVLSQHPNTHFVMAGDGLEPGNTELGAWIGQTGRRERFHLLGRRSDMPAILAAADIVALTSDTEAFPLVIGEAMATGIPCVSTDVGDARHLIADTGRIVPPRDAPAFAAGLSDLVAVPAEERRAMGERARARMQIEFDIRRVAARYDELWYALAAGERPCA